MNTQLASRAIAASASTAPFAFGIHRGGQTPQETHLLERTRLFLAAIEQDTLRSADDLTNTAGAFYAADVVQEEFPNRFLPGGATRNFNDLSEAAKRGRKVMRAQRFEPRSAHAVGDTVILELMWAGTLAVPVGALAAGDEMRAHFAVFLEYRGDLVVQHRTYDCFEPF